MAGPREERTVCPQRGGLGVKVTLVEGRRGPGRGIREWLRGCLRNGGSPGGGVGGGEGF